MNPISTTLREILSTGKLGHLYAGMKRELVAELMPELNPPDNLDSWLYRGIEIFYHEDAVSYYKIALKWDNFGFPKHVNVTGYVPTENTTIDEFVQYMEAENLNYQPLWNSWGAARWLVIYLENKALAVFDEDNSTLLGIWFFPDAENQQKRLWDIAGNIALNIYDLLKPFAAHGQLLSKEYKYKPASVQISRPNDFHPDVSFLTAERNIQRNYISGVPDLAVMVIKPNMDDANLKWQISIYLSEGTKQVWLVYPKTKEVHQYTSATPEQSRIYRGAEAIDAESLFPKIEGLTTTAIFKLPKWAIKEKK
jgi:hypothetical protein